MTGLPGKMATYVVDFPHGFIIGLYPIESHEANGEAPKALSLVPYLLFHCGQVMTENSWQYVNYIHFS